MNTVDVGESVRTALVAVCRCESDTVGRNTRLFDLGIDSLGRSAIVAMVIAEIGVQLFPGALYAVYQADTFGELVDAITLLRTTG